MSEQITENTQMNTTAAPAVKNENHMMNIQDIFLQRQTRIEEKARENKYLPTNIQDHYRIGSSLFDHIRYLKTLMEKEEKSEKDTMILDYAKSNIMTIRRFLQFTNFQKARFLNFSFQELNQIFFLDTNVQNDLTLEILESWNSSNIQARIHFNTLMSLFYYRKNLSTDDLIGMKIYDFYFLISVLHFSFQLKSSEYPTNEEIYHITQALAMLSNEGENYSIQNVNQKLSQLGYEIQFKMNRNSSLNFYANRCPANSKKQSTTMSDL